MRILNMTNKARELTTPKVSTAFDFPQDKVCGHCGSVIELESVKDVERKRRDIGYQAYTFRLEWTCAACERVNVFSSEQVDIDEWKRLRGKFF